MGVVGRGRLAVMWAVIRHHQVGSWVVTWRAIGSRWAGSRALLGRLLGSDVAGSWALLGGVVGGGGVDEHTPGWPKHGQSPGRSMAAVAATHGGGGGW